MRGKGRAFIRANTALSRPPLVPELRLHLAGDAFPLWHASEAMLQREGLPPPFWAFAWAGGQALARHILDQPHLVAGRRVLDFAAGGGVVGLAALRAGAAHVTAAEIDPLAAAAIRLNARANGFGGRIEILCRDLLCEPVALAAPCWDVVLAGDVSYERAMAAAVFAWLHRQAAAGALVLCGDPGRAYLPSRGLTHLASYTVPTDPALEDRLSCETAVLRVG